MSSRSNYSLYAPYVSGGSNVSGPSQSASRVGVPKEQEVDALTDLLVQGMEDNVETDFYGMCVKCGEKVILYSQVWFEYYKLQYCRLLEKTVDALLWTKFTIQSVLHVTIVLLIYKENLSILLMENHIVKKIIL